MGSRIVSFGASLCSPEEIESEAICYHSDFDWHCFVLFDPVVVDVGVIDRNRVKDTAGVFSSRSRTWMLKQQQQCSHF